MFCREAFAKAFVPQVKEKGAHLSVIGARMGKELYEMVQKSMPYPVENDSCVNICSVGMRQSLPKEKDFDKLMEWYAGELLGQMPCMRMMDHTGRKQLYQDPWV